MSTANGKSHIETKTRLLPCPNSLERANLMTSFELHYATRNELKKNGGVCAACRKKFQNHNGAVLAGEIETPVEISPGLHMPDPALDHAGFVTLGQIGQTIDFDYGEIDEALGEVQETPIEARQMAAELFARVMAWCWSGKDVSLQRATVRFAVIASGLRPDMVSNFTFQEIAAKTGCTKQAVSKVAKRFEAAFNGFKFSRSRSDAARENMRASMRASHAQRRKDESR